MVHNEYNNNVYNNARTKLLYIHRVLFCIFATWNLMEKNEDDVTTGSERTGAWMDWMDSAADVLSLHPSLLFHCSVVEVSSLARSLPNNNNNNDEVLCRCRLHLPRLGGSLPAGGVCASLGGCSAPVVSLLLLQEKGIQSGPRRIFSPLY